MKKISFFGTIITLVIVLVNVTSADVPQLISFQGKLYDNEDNPLTGKYEVTFRIYSTESGGSHVWVETLNLNCENGLYSVILGKTATINLDFDSQYWLGVQVAGDVEQSPRYQLVSVPTAFRAQVANSATQVSWTNLTDIPVGFADGIDDEGVVVGDGWVDDGKIVRLETGTDNVGIGTKNPKAQLHANTTFFVGQGSGNNPQISFSDEGDYGRIQSWNGALSINPLGNSVGIKTTNPTHSLTVNGHIGIQQAGISKYHIGYHNGGLNFAETKEADYRLFLEDGGNVGVGTRNPLTALDIFKSGYANLRLDGTLAGILILGDSNAPESEKYFYLGGYGDKLKIGTVSDLLLNYSTKFTMLRNGNVGIGLVSPSYRLDVGGTIRGNNVAPSDVRIKKEINPIEKALERVNSLRGVNFRWQSEKESNGLQIGVIAQEVEAVFPEAVSTDEMGYKSVAYGRLVAPLIEAIKELKAENESLKERIELVEAKLQE